MALHSLRSGYATLQYEIAEEKASALGRLGRRLEAALTALAACPRTAGSNRKIRDGLVEQAGYALWLLAVQRETCGLNNLAHLLQVYRVPDEVAARMAPLAVRGIDRAQRPWELDKHRLSGVADVEGQQDVAGLAAPLGVA